MKRKLCLILTLVFTITCGWLGGNIPEVAAQAKAVSINLANASAAAGTTVLLPVFLQAAGAQVGSLAIDIGFNPKMLLNPSASINPALDASSLSSWILISNTPSPGIFRLAIIPNYTAGPRIGQSSTLIPDGQVATVTFLLSSSAPPGSKLSLTNTPSSCTPKGELLATVGRGAEITVSSQASVEEICDGKDNDGDGQIDEGLSRPCSTACGQGYEVCRNGQWVDCSAPLPQPEICDGKDNDCDGQIDEEVPWNFYFADHDGDGYGQAAESKKACSAPSGYVSNSDDCDDTDSHVHPGAQEIPCNGKDDDCQGGDDTTRCGQQQTSGECKEDDSGDLDIQGALGQPGQEVKIGVRVRYAPSSISAFGFDVLYDTSRLRYTGSERGNLTTSFPLFEVNEITPGRVRVGGLSQSPLPQGANGYLVWLKFMVLGNQQGQGCYWLGLDNLIDDLVLFSPSGGCFCFGRSCTGDQNGDGNITPQDALLVFRCYLGLIQCPECADVDGNGSVTPADALCLFKRYLGQPSCLD